MDAHGTAVVTGASRGLGRALALELAGAGFDVVATMRDPDAGRTLPGEAPPGGGTITVAALDVTKPETIALPSSLRVLVNNAGTERAYLPVESVPMEDWRDVFETNFFGVVEVTRRAVPLMRAGGGGVICNITSASLLMSVPFYGVYRASKAAVQTMGETLRAEVAPFGIRVVEVLPGPVDTDMLADSDRRPEAAEVPGYLALAEAVHQGRAAVGEFVTPPATAAAAVVRAVLDDTGPLRWSCDRLGGRLLAGWQDDPERSLAAR
ncbi:MAG TPA: SDR family NAD(P)-dependent oxidoreductase [Acidimicrobiales bacterium]|nr:SDR family NAD(P)-dependent oxidoreductase [Acidimicrobiales bacterium]